MLSPWTNKNEKWPPAEHEERLAGYKKFRQLFMGEHQHVFPRIDTWLNREMDKTLIYVVCNYAGLVSKICADLLFGEPARFTAGEEGSAEQEALDGIVNNNHLHIKNYEMALSASWRGDTVLKARFGKRRGWDSEAEPIVESVPADYFFPHLNGDNVQEMTGATLAWVKEDNNKKYLRKEIHEPGLIRNELWLLDGDTVKEQVKLSTLPGYEDMEDEQETGYEGLLVEHVPNWRLDDMFWGISDYYDLESMFDALNNRVSKIDAILDKHSDPKLILPPGSMEYDERTGRYYIEKDAIQVMEIDSTAETRDLPRYLVWDAQLEAAFRQIDKLLDLLMMMSEVSPAAFGLDKQGVADSGRALKFRLIRTLAKVNRKQLYFDQALKNILYAAQVLDVTQGRGGYEPTEPHIEWADGLPDDPAEQADIEATRMTSGTTSLESAVVRLDGLEGEALQEELERIRGDRTDNAGPEPGEGLKLRALGGGLEGEAGAGGRTGGKGGEA
jgi:hypothetical protein